MGYYVFVFAATTLLGFYYDSLNSSRLNTIRQKKQQRWIISLIIFIYVIFVGCRGYSVGSDTPMYVYRLQSADNVPYSAFIEGQNYVEPVFYSLVWVFGNVAKKSYYIFFIASALFYFIVLLKFSLRNTNNLGWSIWLFNSLGFATLAISNIRQSIAIAFCLIAYMLMDKSKWKTWLFVILAILTHLSAVVIVPMLFINVLRRRNIILVFALLLGIVSVAGTRLMGSMAMSYAQSTGKEVYESADGQGVGGLGMIAFLALILIMGTMSYFPKNKNYPKQYYNEFIAVGFALIVFMISRFNQGTMRLFWYYLIFSAIYIPNVYSVKRTPKRQFWQIVLFLLTTYYLTTRIMASPYEETRMLLPYSFVWE